MENYGVIVVHHHGGVDWIVSEYIDNNPPIEDDGDAYFEGDHDYASRFLIESKDDLEDLIAYQGHGRIRVQLMVEDKLKKLF